MMMIGRIFNVKLERSTILDLDSRSRQELRPRSISRSLNVSYF